jgi:chemotaxis protein histidine kinase CheA
MVKSQMEALGGHIEIKSKVDEGTQLILTFKK